MAARAELRGDVRALRANTAALRRCNAALRAGAREGAPVSAHLRSVRALRTQNRELARAAAAGAAGVVGEERVAFEGAVEEFSGALRESVECEKEALAVAVGAARTESEVAVAEEEAEKIPLVGNENVYAPASLETAREQAMKREIHSNNLLVRERDTALREIQTSVDDVNSIFKDLAVMIGEQAAQLEHVEVALGDAVENVSGARRELAKTQRRRDARKRFFFCTLLIIAAIFAVFLIVLLS